MPRLSFARSLSRDSHALGNGIGRVVRASEWADDSSTPSSELDSETTPSLLVIVESQTSPAAFSALATSDFVSAWRYRRLAVSKTIKTTKLCCPDFVWSLFVYKGWHSNIIVFTASSFVSWQVDRAVQSQRHWISISPEYQVEYLWTCQVVFLWYTTTEGHTW